MAKLHPVVMFEDEEIDLLKMDPTVSFEHAWLLEKGNYFLQVRRLICMDLRVL